jgi:hypothetical protein
MKTQTLLLLKKDLEVGSNLYGGRNCWTDTPTPASSGWWALGVSTSSTVDRAGWIGEDHLDEQGNSWKQPDRCLLGVFWCVLSVSRGLSSSQTQSDTPHGGPFSLLQLPGLGSFVFDPLFLSSCQCHLLSFFVSWHSCTRACFQLELLLLQGFVSLFVSLSIIFIHFFSPFATD